jgi:predicted RNA binding protein YcfA (HicA-like mRNA interferase family)
VKKVKDSHWSASKAKVVLAALLRTGWQIKRTKGSHRTLSKIGWANFVFAYHDRVEIGPGALAILAKKTGLRPQDL